MAAYALRSAIAKALRDLGDDSLQFTGPQRFKMYSMIESWRQELKTVELETLQAEETLETLAEAKPAKGEISWIGDTI